MSTPELDTLALLEQLGVEHPRAVVPVFGGADSRIWRVEGDRGTFALRVLRPPQQDVAAREIQALDAARVAGIPVPELHAHAIWDGRPALLLDWCAGRTLAAALMEQPWRVRSLGLQFGRMQARIHRIAPPGGWNSDEWIGWAGNEPALAARLRLARLARPALLHGDYHPLNVLTDGKELTAILDWANVRAGDPRADVARTFTILRVMPFGPRPSLAMSVRRRMLAWFWRRGYQEIAGSPGDDALFRAWAGAVMQRDLAHRVGQPDSWLQPRHMRRIQRWTERQRRAARL